MNWEFLRSDEMASAIKKSGGLCVMPLGCTEKHGEHMPLGTDSLQVKHHVELAAELEDVVIFPTGMWLGDMVPLQSRNAPETVAKCHGGIALSPHTLLTVMEELCDEIARNGFRKILIVNCHGGNLPFLNFFLRAQASKKKNYATMVVQDGKEVVNKADVAYNYFKEHRADYPMLTDSDIEVLKSFAEREGSWGGGHANFMETAFIMGEYPELIATERYELVSGLSTHRTDYLTDLGVACTGSYDANFPNVISGYPSTGCTETIGQAFNLFCARRLARIFKVLKEDEECIKIAKGE